MFSSPTPTFHHPRVFLDVETWHRKSPRLLGHPNMRSLDLQLHLQGGKFDGNTWEILGTTSGDMKKNGWKYSNYLEWRWEVEEVETQWSLEKLHDFLVPFTEFLKSTRVGFPTPNEGVLSIKDDLEAKIILKTWAWHTWDWSFKGGAILMSFGTCFEYLRECIHCIHPEIFT